MRSKNVELMNGIRQYAGQFFIENRRSPSTSEIARHFGINKSTVYRYLMEMDDRGMLHYNGGDIVTDITRKVQTEFVSMPVVGAIPCGSPEEEEANVEEYVTLPRSMFGDGNFYILKASGDSMVDAGIESGSMVVIKSQSTADPGQIVAAICDNKSTLKRLLYDQNRKRLVLHPENAEKGYEDIVPDIFGIQGVAVYVMKPL